MPKLSRTWGWALASFLLAALLWEICGRYLISNKLLFVPLSDVLRRTVSLWSDGELQRHILVSLAEFSGGFALATVVGIALGIVLAASRIARSLFEPWISFLFATPVIALGPIFVIWLGIGLGSKIAIIFLVAVFPIAINTLVGLTTTDRTLIEVGRSLGGSPIQIYAKIRVPSALPFIIVGLRLGVARGLVGVVVAELFGARAGLGFLIVLSAQNFDTAALYAGVLILALTGVASVEFLKWIEARLVPWRVEGDKP